MAQLEFMTKQFKLDSHGPVFAKVDQIIKDGWTISEAYYSKIGSENYMNYTFKRIKEIKWEEIYG